MSDKPVLFISYSHLDEPEHPRADEVQWLTFVQRYLKPAVKDGRFEVWDDRYMAGGTDWDAEIERRLRECDVFVLLVSTHSMASDYVIDKEIAIVRERQGKGEEVHFYPIVLTPTPKAGLDKVKDKNLRPRDGKPLSSYPLRDRTHHMSETANEIAAIVDKVTKEKAAAAAKLSSSPTKTKVRIFGLPAAPNINLVGRDYQLKMLDDAWDDPRVNIVSLVAEGGAGKSSLLNEWLVRLQRRAYAGAEVVLGWSFYSESSTSADTFLNSAVNELDLSPSPNTTSAKAASIAQALGHRRILLALDGVERLQYGPGPDFGKLKDYGLRDLLRRAATNPPNARKGLIVLTSRTPLGDIDRWRKSSAPIIDVERLSVDAGAALLVDIGVYGPDKELRAAVNELNGHPLALHLLGNFIRDRHQGDIRQRDQILALLDDADDQDHVLVPRMLDAYEKKRLAEEPVMTAVLDMVGLFDRTITSGELDELERAPAIEGLTESLVGLRYGAWDEAITELRNVGLLKQADATRPGALDVHPLVREWLHERAQRRDQRALQEARRRISDRSSKITASNVDEEKIAPPQVPLPAPSPATRFHYVDGRFDVVPPTAWQGQETRAAIYHLRARELAISLADRLGKTDAVPDAAGSVGALIDVLGEGVDQLQPDQLRLASRSIAARARAFGHPSAHMEISPESVRALFELADVLVDLQSFVRNDIEEHESAIRQLDLTPGTAAETKEVLDLITDGILSNRELISERAEIAFETATVVSDTATDHKVQVAIEGDRILITSNLALAVARELGRADAGAVGLQQRGSIETRSARQRKTGSSPREKRRTATTRNDEKSWADFRERILRRIEKKAPDAIADAVIQAAVSTIKHAPKTVGAIGAILLLWPILDPLVLSGGTAASIMAWIAFQLRRSKSQSE